MPLYDPKKRRFPQVAGALSMDRSPVPDTPAPPPDIAQVPAHLAVDPVKPVPSRSTAGPRIAKADPIPSASSAAQNDYESLRARGSGISHIKNPILRTLAQIGDVAAGTFAPRAEQLIPGTEGNYAMKLGRASDALDVEQGQRSTALKERQTNADIASSEADTAEKEATRPARTRLTEAQATNAEAQPEIQAAKNQTELQKMQNAANAAQAKLDAAVQQNADKNEIARLQLEAKTAGERLKVNAALAQHGLQMNAEGTPEALPYEQLSIEQQSMSDLKKAQADLAHATAGLREAEASNAPERIALERARIAGANQARQIAIERLGLSEATYNARYRGTGPNGAPLPGAVVTEQGQPVGSTFSANVRPTAQAVNKGTLAKSANEQLADIREILTRRTDLFGPGPGRATDINVWLGSQDPDAQKFRNAKTIAAGHMAGIYGSVAQAEITKLDDTMGAFKTNPKAAIAGLQQLEKANTTFKEAGTRRTVGSNAASAQPVVPPPKTKGDPLGLR